MKILSVVGARPQFIKTSLLSRKLREDHDEHIIHTGQHYDHRLSQTFFEELNIPSPSFNLKVGSGTHGYQTAEMLKKLEALFVEQEPDLVIIYGDTNSTLAAALAASKLHIPIAHIEAGMRNFDRKKPEEINRILAGHAANYHFAPTKTAVQNLNNEGIKDNIWLVGDTQFDVLLKYKGIAEEKSNITEELALEKGGYYILTIHKSKNTDSARNLEDIIKTVSKVDFPIIFPVHPRTRKCIENYGLMHYLEGSQIRLIEPQGFYNFTKLLANSKKIITDSGGVQKEAYAYKVPCITMRKTEWVETVEEGWNIIADIHDEPSFLGTINNFEPQHPQKKFLGEGDTYLKITQIINNGFSE